MEIAHKNHMILNELVTPQYIVSDKPADEGVEDALRLALQSQRL